MISCLSLICVFLGNLNSIAVEYVLIGDAGHSDSGKVV